uniref:cytidylyltransferase domain-containing protein n=1 Tax=Algoriphagus sp. TaxID=1872435 RepID=UPI00404767C8
MKIVAVVQARMGSSRLPGKVMKVIQGKPMIDYQLKRLCKSKLINKIVVATSTNTENDILADYVAELGIEVFRGSENNVLERFYLAAVKYQPDIILRITADCPLIDFSIIDQMIKVFLNSNVDYLTNAFPPTFPDGLDTEIFTFNALKKTYLNARKPLEKEHVTPYIRDSGEFKILNYSNSTDFSNMRWTVDEPSDFEVISGVFSHFYPIIDFNWMEIVQLTKLRPEIFSQNSSIIRNEGFLTSKLNEVKLNEISFSNDLYFDNNIPLSKINEKLNILFESICFEFVNKKYKVLDLRFTSDINDYILKCSVLNFESDLYLNQTYYNSLFVDNCVTILRKSKRAGQIKLLVNEGYLFFIPFEDASKEVDFTQMNLLIDFARYGILFQGMINLSKVFSDDEMYYFLKVFSKIIE